METIGPVYFEVHKANLTKTRLIQQAETALKKEQVRLTVDEFALTANNITYGAFGDQMRYWSFFPSEDSDWGRLPVWGFATVSESLSEDIETGERFYGFYPMGTELVVDAGKLRYSGFTDMARHRSDLPAFYNQYLRVSADPSYRADFESQQMLFRPLFSTSFLIDDVLAERQYSGATQVLLSSASSKTAIALAWLLKQKDVNCIALTSEQSRPFVKNTRLYDSVALYDELEETLNLLPTVYVDFSGNGDVLAKVHNHFQDDLKASIRVGAADWRGAMTSQSQELPGAQSEFFFAPTEAARRLEEWGVDEFNRRLSEGMLDFFEPASKWIKTVRGTGPDAIEECYNRLQSGKVLPSEGFVLSF